MCGGGGGGGQCLTKNLEVLKSHPRTEMVTLEDSVNTARCSVDLRLIIVKFVNYNNRVPSPSRLPNVTHVILSPTPSPSVFACCKRSKKMEPGTVWKRGYASG